MVFEIAAQRGSTLKNMFSDDFRNFSIHKMEKLFAAHQCNSQKILCFQNSYRSQAVSGISELKGVKLPQTLVRSLPCRSLELSEMQEDEHGNRKFRFVCEDGSAIESVYMPSEEDVSICVSVQAGCRFGCEFCATGRSGFIRDLQPYEIIDQVRQVMLKCGPESRLDAVTFMGMGDPMDNLESSMHALDWLTSGWGYRISRKKCTFSTSGAHDFDKFLSYENLPNLAVSLHSAVPDIRKQIMPGVRLSLEDLKLGMLEWAVRMNKYVTVEYCLMHGVNDQPEHADALINYLCGFPCKINLLNCNPVKGSDYMPVHPARLTGFMNYLHSKGLTVLHRKSLGTSIFAGCGQLKTNF